MAKNVDATLDRTIAAAAKTSLELDMVMPPPAVLRFMLQKSVLQKQDS